MCMKRRCSQAESIQSHIHLILKEDFEVVFLRNFHVCFPNQELCQSPPIPQCLTFLFLYIVFVVLLEGLDAVQVAVASRDCLSSPPFINKWVRLGRLSAATEEQQAGLSLHSEASPRLSIVAFPLYSSPHHTLTSLSHNSLPSSRGLSGVGPPTLACVKLSGKQHVWVCTPPDRFFFHKTSFQRSLGVGGQTSLWGRRADPLSAVIWLNKQRSSDRRLLQRAPGTTEINLRLWTSEGSIDLKRRPRGDKQLEIASSGFWRRRLTAGTKQHHTERAEACQCVQDNSEGKGSPRFLTRGCSWLCLLSWVKRCWTTCWKFPSPAPEVRCQSSSCATVVLRMQPVKWALIETQT